MNKIKKTIPLQIIYNDNLVARCLLVGMSADVFLSEYVNNPTPKQIKQVKADFDRMIKIY